MNKEKLIKLVKFLEDNDFNFSLSTIEHTNFGTSANCFDNFKELEDFVNKNPFARFDWKDLEVMELKFIIN
jgi:hypothetical protein